MTGSGDTVNQGKINPLLPQVRRKLGNQDQDTLDINDIVYIKLMMQRGIRRDISVTFMNKLVPAAMMYAKSHDPNATYRGTLCQIEAPIARVRAGDVSILSDGR